jgi:hypothetical protein
LQDVLAAANRASAPIFLTEDTRFKAPGRYPSDLPGKSLGASKAGAAFTQRDLNQCALQMPVSVSRGDFSRA